MRRVPAVRGLPRGALRWQMALLAVLDSAVCARWQPERGIESPMVYHIQKRWRLRFRRDPDAGRVLFIGPFVISLDVIRGARSRA